MDDDEGGPDVFLKNLTSPQDNPGVESFVIMNDSGIAVKASNDMSIKIQGQAPVPNELAAKYAANISFLLNKIRSSVKNQKPPADSDIDSSDEEEEDDVVNIRLRTRDREIIVVPSDNYTLITIQYPFKPKVAKTEKKEEKKGE